jgi:hypothetical protein
MEQSITGLIELLLNTRPELLFFVAGTCAGAIFIILGISDYIMPRVMGDLKGLRPFLLDERERVRKFWRRKK